MNIKAIKNCGQLYRRLGFTHEMAQMDMQACFNQGMTAEKIEERLLLMELHLQMQAGHA